MNQFSCLVMNNKIKRFLTSILLYVEMYNRRM